MKAIFELYNADGSLQIDLSNQIPKTLGVMTLNSNNGAVSQSVTRPEWSSGRPWWFMTSARSTMVMQPEFTMNGNTLTCNISVSGSPGWVYQVVYGVY